MQHDAAITRLEKKVRALSTLVGVLIILVISPILLGGMGIIESSGSILEGEGLVIKSADGIVKAEIQLNERGDPHFALYDAEGNVGISATIVSGHRNVLAVNNERGGTAVRLSGTASEPGINIFHGSLPDNEEPVPTSHIGVGAQGNPILWMFRDTEEPTIRLLLAEGGPELLMGFVDGRVLAKLPPD